MNHITFKDKEGFDINVLAFDGESNFAILDRTSTGSPTPYVVVKGLDTESATWSNSEGYFSNYEDCVLLRDPDENVKQVWTASGEFLSTVQLENETVDEAMEEYYYNISKGDVEL